MEVDRLSRVATVAGAVDSEKSARCACTTSKLVYGKSFPFWVLMIASLLANLVGGTAAVLLGRLYFVHGGSDRWLYTWLQSVGWPLLMLPLAIGHGKLSPARLCVSTTHLHCKLVLSIAVIGLLLGIDNLLFSWGLSYLPLSTSSLLYATQLPFNLLFSWLLVRQKISSYILNSVVLVTMSAVLLGMQSSSDKPSSTRTHQYAIGFVLTIAGSAIYGLLLPLTQLTFTMVGSSGFVVVVGLQIGTSIVATVFSVLGMWISGTFRTIHHELHRFDLGPAAYVMTLAWCAIAWQLATLGGFGIIFLASSLTSCVFMTARLPVVPILAVFIFHDGFTGLKAMSMALAIWGFLSYVYAGFVECVKSPSNQSNNYDRLTQKAATCQQLTDLQESDSLPASTPECHLTVKAATRLSASTEC